MNKMEGINVLKSSFNNNHKCKISKPHLVNYFTYDLNENQHLNDFSGLKYVPEVYFKSGKETRKYRIQMKHTQPLFFGLDSEIIWTWIYENENQLYIQNAEFITQRDVLSEIMTIPFKRNKENDYYVSVTLKRNKIFLKESDENHVRINRNYFSKYFLTNYRRFLVNDERNKYKPCTLHIRRNSFDKTFYEIFEILIEKHRILYYVEVDGIFSVNPINSLEDLHLAIHVENSVTNFIPLHEYRKKKLNSQEKSLDLWAKTKLSLAEHTVNAIYFKENVLSSLVDNQNAEENNDILWSESLIAIKIRNVDSLPRKCSSQWSSKRSLQFLNEFLCSVKEIISTTSMPDRNVSEWTLRCTPKLEVFVHSIKNNE